MLRMLLAAIAALSIALTLATTALAADPGLDGEPTLDHSKPVGYYIWHDDNGFHLRTHGPGDAHLFEARLRTDGTFVDVDTVRLESRDDIAVDDGGRTLLLRFHTFNHTDGVNFRVRDGDWLRLNLQLDGKPIATESIYLGRSERHPRQNPFTMPI